MHIYVTVDAHKTERHNSPYVIIELENNIAFMNHYKTKDHQLRKSFEEY